MLFVVLAVLSVLAAVLAVMSDDGSTETDAVELQSGVQKALLPMVTKIYRAHWKKTWNVDDHAMMSAKKLEAKVDLQPGSSMPSSHILFLRLCTHECSTWRWMPS